MYTYILLCLWDTLLFIECYRYERRRHNFVRPSRIFMEVMMYTKRRFCNKAVEARAIESGTFLNPNHICSAAVFLPTSCEIVQFHFSNDDIAACMHTKQYGGTQSFSPKCRTRVPLRFPVTMNAS
jgi:hypothetical protein